MAGRRSKIKGRNSTRDDEGNEDDNGMDDREKMAGNGMMSYEKNDGAVVYQKHAHAA